jgi:phytoene/squalene synthetase
MAIAALEPTPAGVPGAPAVMARAGGENFPVASRLLAPADRRALLAVYGFARLADELGDELRGDRLAALDWLERELDRAYAGASSAHAGGGSGTGYTAAPDARESNPGGASSVGVPVTGESAVATPLFDALRRVLAERTRRGAGELPREAFGRLIEANRLDQRVVRYETWEQLRDYCHLSADPVGELVLAIFDLRTSERVALSDRVCTGLQLTEHLQDVAEDLARGRVYLPGEDLDRFGCSREAPGGPALREVVAFELARARELLWAGAPLAASVSSPRPRLAIAAFAAGGLAALERIESAGCDVSSGVAPAGGGARLRWLVRVLRGAHPHLTGEVRRA